MEILSAMLSRMALLAMMARLHAKEIMMLIVVTPWQNSQRKTQTMIACLAIQFSFHHVSW